jgi:uncharacterized membrane protein YphA (DoxX/SURF4 family)
MNTPVMTPPVMTLGRFLLVLTFLIAGAKHAMDIPGTANMIASKGFPQPHLLAALTIAVEIGGALLVIFNRFTAPAALALAGLCVTTAIVSNNFWAQTNADNYTNLFNHFMTNIALAGAFLSIAATPSLERLAELRQRADLRQRVRQLELQSRPASP